MPDEPPETDEAEDSAKPTIIQPARPWPVYNVDRAKAELIAMELLYKGLSEYRVRIMTKLSARNVARLARILAEDAKNPPAERLAPRTRRRATIRPARRPRPPGGQDATRPTPLTPAAPPTQRAPAEPEQMAFSLD
ncbi:hypothetical protein [Streptomyces nigrescens]|uniref:hypothetical protein n=1 Tax=Streptomyces nigrescens TaxID=1920 RepID=UPI0036FFCD4A